MDQQSTALPLWLVVFTGIAMAATFSGVLLLNVKSDPISPVGVILPVLLIMIGLAVALHALHLRKT